MNSFSAVDVVFTGLAFDVAGAVLLAKGFILKSWEDAWVEALTISGANSNYIRSAMLQRAEAMAGGFLLVLGYLLQMWGNLHGAVEASALGRVNSSARLGLLCASCWFLSWAVWRLAIEIENRRHYRRMFAGFEASKIPIAWKEESTGHQIARQLRHLLMRRRRGETDEQVRIRIDQRRMELWKKYNR